MTLTAGRYQLPGRQRYLCLSICSMSLTTGPQDQIFAAWSKHVPKISVLICCTLSMLLAKKVGHPVLYPLDQYHRAVAGTCCTRRGTEGWVKAWIGLSLGVHMTDWCHSSVYKERDRKKKCRAWKQRVQRGETTSQGSSRSSCKAAEAAVPTLQCSIQPSVPTALTGQHFESHNQAPLGQSHSQCWSTSMASSRSLPHTAAKGWNRMKRVWIRPRVHHLFVSLFLHTRLKVTESEHWLKWLSVPMPEPSSIHLQADFYLVFNRNIGKTIPESFQHRSAKANS